MNPYLKATIDALNTHGVTASYIKVQEGEYDPETGSTVNTETTTSIKTYPKAVKVSQYNYPNLIGKTVLKFLVAGNAITGSPSVMDKIEYKSNTYTVDSYTEHTALGEIALYQILGVKG